MTVRQAARTLRTNSTEAERVLWQHLRAARLSGYKFRRQTPLGRYIVDFVCFEARLIVEVDGGQHAGQQEYDTERTAWLETQGFRVLRFWNTEVLSNVEAVKEMMPVRVEEHPPLPSPLPLRERGLETLGA